MTTVSAAEFQAKALMYLRLVEAGEAIIVSDGDRPIAEIKPLAPPPTQKRPLGLCDGQLAIPADFDAPLPEEVLRGFGV